MNENQELLYPEPPGDTKFIVDAHLGRLAKYLRLCGFDSLFENSLTDREIVDISVAEKRIILTRDRELLKAKRIVRGYWVRSIKPVEQLREVISLLDLEESLHPFTRCIVCNGLLMEVQKEKVIDDLPQRTRDYYTEFRKCDNCGRIYWKGSHYERMKKLIRLTVNDIRMTSDGDSRQTADG